MEGTVSAALGTTTARRGLGSWAGTGAANYYRSVSGGPAVSVGAPRNHFFIKLIVVNPGSLRIRIYPIEFVQIRTVYVHPKPTFDPMDNSSVRFVGDSSLEQRLRIPDQSEYR